MQQRRLRLGDVLDDYCPRERRVTNHLIVAMIEDTVRQTRCTTCNADHEYKEAKVPAVRRPKPAGAIFADAPEPVSQLRPAAPPAPAPAPSEPPALETPEPETIPMAAAPAGDAPDALPADDEGPVHRRLIRATLPRPEGQTPERRAPEFTVRQPGSPGRGREVDGNRAGQRPRGQRQAQFGGFPGGQSRFNGSRQGGHGGHGGGQGGQRHDGGRGQGAGQPGQPGQGRGGRQGSGRGRRRGGR